jgi:hypothetical protein
MKPWDIVGWLVLAGIVAIAITYRVVLKTWVFGDEGLVPVGVT